MICPLCGSSEARTTTVNGQVAYQLRDGHPCYVVMSLAAYNAQHAKAEAYDALEKATLGATHHAGDRVLVDARAVYAAVNDSDLGLE